MDLNKFTIEFFEGVYNTPSLINEDNPPIQFEEEDPTLIDRMEDEEIFEIRSSGESAVVDYE